MRSFILSAFAFLVFGIFGSAAPTPSNLPTVNVPPVPVAARDTTVPTEDNQTLQSVLTVATNDANSLADRVANLHTADAVEGVLCPILEQLVVILKKAVSGVQKLADVPVEKSLVDINTGVLYDVRGIVGLIVPLLRIVLCLLQNVLSLVSGTLKDDVLPLVTEICILLTQLLSAILILVNGVVTGVLAGVVNLIQDLIPFIDTLNIRELRAILGISI